MSWIRKLIDDFLFKRELRKRLKQARKNDPYIYK